MTRIGEKMIEELIKLSEAAVVAMTILGEAEGEPWAGKVMVAETIVNRAKASGGSLKYECLKANQFSCWNGEEQQRKLINRAACYENNSPARNATHPPATLERSDCGLGSVAGGQAWRDCKEIARSVCQAGYQSTTTATHYYAPALRSVPPVWVKNMKLAAVVGGHRFYRETK